ncbi:MAG: CoA-binding protein [Propionibacteriales bacterium]|nr:CoA-binding protein [Propionibacteriales bacterium]
MDETPVPAAGEAAEWGDEDTIRWILSECETWAVIGLGDNPFRPARQVAKFLQQHGKRIVPVHPSAVTVLGEPGYATLAEVPFAVDCVDVFRRASAAGEFADQAMQIGARAVWFQLGVIDQAAHARTVDGGLEMVMDRCPVIEWPAYGPPA